MRRSRLFSLHILKFLLTFGLLATFAKADNLDLEIVMTGTRIVPPEWYNSSSTKITDLTFDLSGFVTTANTNIDSTVQAVKIVDAQDPGGTKVIDITRPSGCSIGSTSIANNHVRVLVNSVEYTNTSVNFTENSLVNLAIRFRAVGNYGDDTGLITCNNQGQLNHTY